MRSLSFVLVVAIIAFLPPAQATEPEVRVIPLKHRLASEVTPAINPLLAPGESVTAMDSRLIVRASPRTLAQIETLLEQIDVARRNLRISIRHSGTQSSQSGSQGVRADTRTGNTRVVIGGGTTGSGGLVVGRTGPGGNVQLHTERRTSTISDQSTQTLMVLDGGRGFLRVGESIPQVQQFLLLSGNRVVVAAGVQYYDVTTGFDVEPRLVGDRVLLTVSPRLMFRTSQGSQIVEFQELRTQVTATPGEWVDLGGMVESANDVNRQILGSGSAARDGTSRFLVRVDPQ